MVGEVGIGIVIGVMVGEIGVVVLVVVVVVVVRTAAVMNCNKEVGLGIKFFFGLWVSIVRLRTKATE
jgi:hypothetical protein